MIDCGRIEDMNPTLKYENRLKRKGYKLIAGVDEVGRGAWAGPVVAAAVILPANFHVQDIQDSKLLTPKKREELYWLICDRALTYSIAFISHQVVDKQGLAWVNKMVIKRAVQKMRPQPDYVLVDAVQISKTSMPFEAIIGGDRISKTIAAASIIAKVARDRHLIKLEKKFPQYGFAKHKGYGTKLHYEMICKHGVCEVHRKSFAPIKYLTVDY
jgi:ribonuclease HII